MSDEKKMNKMKDLEGMKSAMEALLQQAWDRGYKYGLLEAEKRPTGKWLEWEDERWGGVWYYCSNCRVNALYTSVDGILKQILSDFCPYCGAKMERCEDETEETGKEDVC